MRGNVVIWYALKFVTVLLLQVLLFNNIDYFGFISPYIYLLFFLDLPVNFKTAYAMLSGFLMGFWVDVFGNTMGVHTAACVLLCFVRNTWISMLFSSLNAQQTELTLARVGWIDYLKYIGGLVLLHHTALFLLESLSFVAFGYTLLRIVSNTVVTVSLILFYEYFRSK
ncbi:MAG: hypothetical protein II215_01600 [Paludibacteraceae bacterium]|nr:hypothetical protein [Paludibacteraceae bacterium]